MLLPLGIALSTLKPLKITLSDIEEVVPLIKTNVIINKKIVNDPYLQDAISRIEAIDHSWGTAIANRVEDAENRLMRLKFGVIVASDVVYYPEGYQPLIESLKQLLVPQIDQPTEEYQRPVAIIAHRHRHPEDRSFFNMLEAVPNIVIEKFDSNSCPGIYTDKSLQDVMIFVIEIIDK